MTKIIQGQTKEAWQKQYPLIEHIVNLEPVFWHNPNKDGFSHLHNLSISSADVYEAEERWQRFASFFAKEFPETEAQGGIIESPLKNINQMKALIETTYDQTFAGDLYLKCDNELSIAGSIKARGGMYEVLKYAETLAIDEGLLSKEDDYAVFASQKFKKFFNEYSIGVGSTGNLGLSIGIISARLGFNVDVHMSADAKQWKKDLLRSHGANVHEYKADFSEAIKEGRSLSQKAKNSYFVDDENSRELFLGYSTAAIRLQKQLQEQGITVDEQHPLCLYLPCGVGGSPGGITYGMKAIFGEHVHCFLVEPTHSPSVLLGLLTGEQENISVQDFGIDNKTEADGLAVGRPSRFATSISEHLIDGIYTIADDDLFKILTMLRDSEHMNIEPSAGSGIIGPIQLKKYDDSQPQTQQSFPIEKATHIAWSTGGDLVPEEDMTDFYEKGQRLLKSHDE